MLRCGKLCSLFLVVVATIHSSTATDFCDPEMCYGLSGHIACNNTGKLSPNCSSDARVIPISDALRDAIIEKHNMYRNMVAGGFDKFPPATRMAKTRWNPELAELARLNVQKCDGEHDTCRNTKAFPYAGQNIAVHYFQGEFDAGETALKQAENWFNEYKNAPSDIVDRYRDPPTNGPVIGSFTGMVQEMGTDMGCAILQQSVSPGTTQQTFTCNYCYINIVNLPCYIGGPTASQCTTGVDAVYRNLCSANEVYDVTGIPHYREY